MRIKTVRIENYRSFLDTGEIAFDPQFNVIVGKNNSGKTAFLRALSLRFENNYHKSSQTIALPGGLPLNEISRVEIRFELEKGELLDLLRNYLPQFDIPVSGRRSISDLGQEFLTALTGKVNFRVNFAPAREGLQGYMEEFENPVEQNTSLRFRFDPRSAYGSLPQLDERGRATTDQNILFGRRVATLLMDRMYLLNAERLSIPEQVAVGVVKLEPDARNLAAAIHDLQSRKTTFNRFLECVQYILPEIGDILAPLDTGNSQVRLFVSGKEAPEDRDDLALRLSDSGTGIGQVLAIIYVIVTSKFPGTMVIDEPQSFLHPGAVHKLLDIFRKYDQYQYVISTHAPNVLSASKPNNVFRVWKDGAESRIEIVDSSKEGTLQACLAEVGARLSDVFGADVILWVEGKSEETCFPHLLSSNLDLKIPLSIKINGVIDTGFLDTKDANRVIGIYRRLSGGSSLIPPTIGYIFDREEKSEDAIKELEQIMGVNFINRRMYENYLLRPEAVAAVLSTADQNTEITSERVTAWLNENKQNRRYFSSGGKKNQADDSDWIERIHGAALLHDLTTEMTETRWNYYDNKAYLAEKLTLWLLTHYPEDLAEVTELITRVINEGTNRLRPKG